ncbi:MAG TPA: zinc-ribbon domain-containing protein, partial [Myxococcaceae bacterium]|nr:zinc-ribbon domain-containing protein [Myxococcaceae bacterium]
MDVRCERCKTEYEFDDARVTEAGVTVKCTSCGHVFRVRRRASAQPIQGSSHEQEVLANGANGAYGAHSAAPGPGDKREWKVRQRNGNVFAFRQLTNLQRWIVEGKVSRDDEISLNAETWKRLGDIAELGVFFRVVEEAHKAKQPDRLQPSAISSAPTGAVTASAPSA